jgi:hypothetical protein
MKLSIKDDLVGLMSISIEVMRDGHRVVLEFPVLGNKAARRLGAPTAYAILQEYRDSNGKPSGRVFEAIDLGDLHETVLTVVK